LLLGRSETGARDHFHYFSQNELHAVRVGPWKLFLPDRKVFYGYVKDRGTAGVELYNLEEDIGEKRNVAAAHPEVVERLLAFARSYPMPNDLPFAGIAVPAPGAKGKKKG